MQCGKKKVPCGGSSALCEAARASPRPPGPHARPLWAPILLPVWWETPDPRGCAGACDTEPGGSGAGDTGRVRRGSHVPGHGAKCREGGGWRDLEAPSGAGSALPPSRRALAEQPEAGKGRREQASVQHCIQLVGQIIEHVADVLQDVLGRVHGPGGAGEGRERWLNAAPMLEVPLGRGRQAGPNPPGHSWAGARASWWVAGTWWPRAGGCSPCSVLGAAWEPAAACQGWRPPALCLPPLGAPQFHSPGSHPSIFLSPSATSPLHLLRCDLLLGCLQRSSQGGVGVLQPLLDQGGPRGSGQRLRRHLAACLQRQRAGSSQGPDHIRHRLRGCPGSDGVAGGLQDLLVDGLGPGEHQLGGRH